MIQPTTKEKIIDFFSNFPTREYKKGELILQPEENKGSFFINAGHVREYGISLQGVEVGLHIFSSGSFFPMTWVIADIPNRYYYEALTNTHISSAPKERTIKFIKENPDVLMDLTKRIFMGVDKLTARIESLSYSKANEKIISILLYLARHFGLEKGNTIIVKYLFTHRDIGSLTGLTRETVSREIEKLEKKNLITYDQKQIIISDIEKLKQKLRG